MHIATHSRIYKMLNHKKIGEQWRAPTAGSNCSQVTTTDSCPTKQGAQCQKNGENLGPWLSTMPQAVGCCVWTPAILKMFQRYVCCCKYWRFFNASDSNEIVSISHFLSFMPDYRLHKTHVSQEGKYIQCLQYRGWLANHGKWREQFPPNLWQAPVLAIGRAQNVEPEKDGTHLIQM